MNSSQLHIFHRVTLSQAKILDFVELTKPRLVFLVLLSAVTGFVLASESFAANSAFFSMLAGTSLVAAGSMALNQWMERSEDSRMMRTARRPIPSGRLTPLESLIFGSALSITGLMILQLTTYSGCVLLAATTLVTYLFLYTPLKKKSSLCTIVGAIPGALPPLIGWSAARESLSFEAWILFSIIFLWQMPHFLAIAWHYRKDYEMAGFRMLAVTDRDGNCVGRQMLLYTLALIPVSFLPTIVGLTGPLYFFGALILGLVFVGLELWGLKRMDEKARFLFLVSVLYLSCLLVLMVADKI